MGTESMESNVMLQLAAEAFQAKNFELAAEIYECQLVDYSDVVSHHELLVKWADALAFGGKLSEALEIYQKASKITRLRPTHLENLIVYLTNSIRSKEGFAGQKFLQGQVEGCGNDAFVCRICEGFLYEPVTLPCGHCFCKKCLDKEKKPVCCRECKDNSRLTDLPNYRVNVVLSNLLAKWFPSQLLAVQLRHEGNALYAEKKLEVALEKYNEAIAIAPRDHLLFINHSLINSSLKNNEDALTDAEMACKLQPYWLKGHLRKAQALKALGKTEEALTECLFCIALDSENRQANLEAQRLLSDIFDPVPNQVQERIPDYIHLLSSRTRVKGGLTTTFSSNCSTSSPGLYKDNCINDDSFTSLGKSTLLSAQSCTRKTGSTDSKACSGDRNEKGGFGGVHGPSAIRSQLTKRKQVWGEEGSAESDGSSCKRLKSEAKVETTSWCPVASELIDASDLECSLCMRLFYEPVTTPCGHSFCLKCLERCLDHNAKCPLCKEDLSEYLAQRRYSKTLLMENLIANYLPEELAERQIIDKEEIAELSNLNKNVPIFVCTMAFPTVPCPLHIYEPCYRLMVRRCMETGTNQFGMCLSDSVNGFATYGCILEIRNVEFFADGRSVVDTIGRRRFKVIQHRKRDGYNTADIEYLEDKKVGGAEEAELRTLHNRVYDQALSWVNSLKAQQKERIVGHFGPMPEKDLDPQISPNGPSWCWWLLAVMPLDGRAQLPFLALTSLKDRLAGIRRVLVFMSRSRSR